MYIWWLISSCDLLSFYPAVHFLNISLSDIIAITNSSGDSASPRNIPLWIFVSAKLPPLCSQFNFPGFHGFLDKIYDFVWYLVHFEQFIIQLCGTISYAFLQSNPGHRWILPYRLTLVVDQCRVALLSLLPLWKNYGLSARHKSLPLFVPLIFSTS